MPRSTLRREVPAARWSAPRAPLVVVSEPRPRPLRVADVAMFYGERSGGIRTYIDAKARHSAATGLFEHHVLVPGPIERHDSGRHELPSLRLAPGNGYRIPIGARALRRTLASIRPDVVLLHDPFWLPLDVIRTVHAVGARVVAVHHSSSALNAAGLRVPRWLAQPVFRAWMHRAYAPRDELRTVLRGGRLDGFLPHTVFWHNHPRWRRAPFYATRGMRGDRATETVGPPLLAFAWERVAAASTDDPGFAREALGELTLHLEWLEHERDVDGEGLLSNVLPDESGLDDSPKYDPVFGRHVHYRVGYFQLIERWRRLGWRAPAIVARHDEHVEDVWVNVAYALSLRSMARLTGEQRWERAAQRTEHALLERCLDPATGLFLDLAGRDERRVRVSTWSALAPVMLDGLPEAVRRRLVEEHLLDPRRYRAAVGIPSVAMDERSFKPGFDCWRTWRGPSWVNVAWLLAPALRGLGYAEEARRLADGLAAAALRSGLREYYDPRSGQGLAAKGFASSALVADLADPRA